MHKKQALPVYTKLEPGQRTKHRAQKNIDELKKKIHICLKSKFVYSCWLDSVNKYKLFLQGGISHNFHLLVWRSIYILGGIQAE